MPRYANFKGQYASRTKDPRRRKNQEFELKIEWRVQEKPSEIYLIKGLASAILHKHLVHAPAVEEVFGVPTKNYFRLVKVNLSLLRYLDE